MLNNPGDSYTTSGFMKMSFTPEYEEGDEIVEKSANGVICVSYKAPDTLKRVTLELAICEPDPELSELMSGGLLLRKNMGTFAAPDRKSIGWSSPAVGDDPSGFGVAIECWSFAVISGKRAASLPYFHWVFPYARLRLTGDRVIENGMLATTFQGYGLGNPLFSTGLDGRWEFPVATERPYSYARSSWAPTGRKGFYEWHGDLSKSISNSARTGTTATLTTSTAHGFRVGDSVTISGTNGNSALHGTYTILTVPTTTTFTYTTTTSGTITSAADTGTALVPANSWAVTDFLSEGSTTDFNVPGSLTFNEDEDIDFIVASAEDPTA
jgi:hypothetical protein